MSDEKHVLIQDVVQAVVASFIQLYLKYEKYSGSGMKGGVIKDAEGGSIKVSLLKKIIDVMEEPGDFKHDGKTYVRDMEFASRVFNVYTQGDKGKDQKVLLIHSPTDPLKAEDVLADAALALNFRTKRVKDVVKRHLLAEKKYLAWTTNIQTVGYSLGAFVAEDTSKKGSKAKEIFLISRPITFLNVRDVLGDKVFSIKSKLDPVGILSRFIKSGSKETELEPGKISGIKAFFREHLAKPVLERLEKKGVKEIGEPEEPVTKPEKPKRPDINLEDIGLGMGGPKEKWSKRRVADIRGEVKELRRQKKVKTKDYPLSGKNKKQLIEMLEELRAI